MATNQLKRVIQTLGRASLHHDDAGLTDGQLLESYVHGEEAAFAALVRRHGPMVWGVCRRVLRSHQDAEDAFQATFLVLIRKAASVVKVANWLYGVAHQTALKARATSARRGTREQQVTAMPEPAVGRQELWDDLRPLLDQELSRLPDKYREVIVVCDLEGKTRKEAARHFDLPEGTVASRLATGRRMLAKRLGRSGLALSGTALPAVLSQNAASASMPASVASCTIKAASLFAAGKTAAAGVLSARAVALAEGVLRVMLLTKLKIATALLIAVAAFGTSVAALTHRAPAEQQQAQVKRVVPEKPAVQPVAEKEKPAVQPAPAEKPEVPPLEEKKQDANKPNDTAKPAQGPGFHGVPVKTVDIDRNTVSFDDKAPAELAGKTIGLAKDAPIAIDGKRGTLAGVPAGAFLSLSLSVDLQTALHIDAQGPSLGGCGGSMVTAVNGEKNTITFDAKAADDVAGKTFTVARDANISIDGKRARLADVPTGSYVNFTLSVDRQTALHVHAQGPPLPCDFGGNPVKAVDTGNRTITFDDKARAEVAGRTFRVAAHANIAIDGKRATLADLPPGCYVSLRFAATDQTLALHVSAEGPFVPCDFGGSLVKAVDIEKSTITFDDKARAEIAGKTFIIAKDANISIDGRRGTLAEVLPGCYVSLRLSVDQSAAFHVGAQGPSVLCDCGGSLVKAVDLARRAITFDDKARAEVAGKTFIVAKDANIVIDGRSGKLTELPPGSYVDLRLAVDQKSAVQVNAQGPGIQGVLVTAVDPARNTVTVDSKTYPVAKNANILINDRQGTLAGLPAGANVSRLRLCVDQRTVGTIFVDTKQTVR